MTRNARVALLGSAIALGAAITIAAASMSGWATRLVRTAETAQTMPPAASQAQTVSNTGSPAPMKTPAVTPKTQAPLEAERLSRAFAATARAMRPSVVRLDVEMGARPIMPSADRRLERPPDIRRFFGFGEGWQAPAIPEMPMPARGTGGSSRSPG